MLANCRMQSTRKASHSIVNIKKAPTNDHCYCVQQVIHIHRRPLKSIKNVRKYLVQGKENMYIDIWSQWWPYTIFIIAFHCEVLWQLHWQSRRLRSIIYIWVLPNEWIFSIHMFFKMVPSNILQHYILP